MEKINVEAKLARLEEITSKMEKEVLPLEEMMSLFSEGKALIKEVEEALKAAEAEVEKLSDKDEE